MDSSQGHRPDPAAAAAAAAAGRAHQACWRPTASRDGVPTRPLRRDRPSCCCHLHHHFDPPGPACPPTRPVPGRHWHSRCSRRRRTRLRWHRRHWHWRWQAHDDDQRDCCSPRRRHCCCDHNLPMPSCAAADDRREGRAGSRSAHTSSWCGGDGVKAQTASSAAMTQNETDEIRTESQPKPNCTNSHDDFQLRGCRRKR